MSDHFKNNRFYNPTLKKQFNPGIPQLIRMFREPRAPWPRYVQARKDPPILIPPGQGEIRITFVNHATFLIQLPGLNILTDPVWSSRASPFAWLGPKRVREPGISLDKLPPIDLILISHNHYDHLDVKTLKILNKRYSPRVITALGDKSLIESLGFRKVDEMDWWEDVDINQETRITFTPAQHFSGRGLWDRYRSLWGSYFIEHGPRSVYYGADSGYSTHYADIRSRLGSPDISLLGIGAYSPNWFMQPIHMNPPEAVTAHQDLGSGISIGMHFGTFRLSAEAIDHPVTELKNALAKASLPPDCFIVLEEGESFLSPP